MKPGDIFGSTWDDGTESVCIVRSADDGRIVGFARFLAISSGSKYIELAGDEVDHRL
jgi:hypothetical protein